MYQFFTVNVVRKGTEVVVSPITEYKSVFEAFKGKMDRQEVAVRCNGNYYKIDAP